MIRQQLMLALLGSALVASPAFAQSMNQPGGSSSPSASSPSTPSPSASASGGTQFMAQAQAGQWRASKLVGVDIYGSNNEKIGDVNEILLDKSGNAQAVVIGVGGFLGVGQKEVAVPFNTVQWRTEPRSTASAGGTAASRTAGSGASDSMSSGAMDYPDHGVISMTREQLQNAPEFKYASDTSKRGNSTAPAGSTNR